MHTAPCSWGATPLYDNHTARVSYFTAAQGTPCRQPDSSGHAALQSTVRTVSGSPAPAQCGRRAPSRRPRRTASVVAAQKTPEKASGWRRPCHCAHGPASGLDRAGGNLVSAPQWPSLPQRWMPGAVRTTMCAVLPHAVAAGLQVSRREGGERGDKRGSVPRCEASVPISFTDPGSAVLGLALGNTRLSAFVWNGHSTCQSSGETEIF